MLTQKEAAEKAGVSLVTLRQGKDVKKIILMSKIEWNYSKPHHNFVRKLMSGI